MTGIRKPSQVTIPPDRFFARASGDDVKRDLELTCSQCGAVICDVEADDDLAVLAEVAAEHKCGEEQA